MFVPTLKYYKFFFPPPPKILCCLFGCSYERKYKSLLDGMIKNDLALKGNLKGAELLIFPSNQLPEKSQRKNLFRGSVIQALLDKYFYTILSLRTRSFQ